MDLTGEDLTCLGWRFADDFSRIFPDDASDLEALAPPEAFHAEWTIRHPIHTILSGVGASAKPALVPGGNWSAHVTRATRPDEVSP